jgi:Glycosyltransferase family 87
MTPGMRVRLARVLHAYARLFPIVFAVAFMVQWSRTDIQRDVFLYYDSARKSNLGLSMYDPIPEPGPYKQYDMTPYPPPFAASLKPAAHLPYIAFSRIWLTILSIAFLVYASAVARLAIGRYSTKGTLIGASILFLVPGFVHSWNMLNADLLIWMLIALALVHSGARRGFALGLATITKVSPMWAFLYAVRSPRAAAGGLLAILGAAFVCIVTLGWSGSIDESLVWLTKIMPILAQGEFWRADTIWQLWTPWGSLPLPGLSPGNLSLSMLPVQLAAQAGLVDKSAELPAIARAWMTFASIAFPITAGILLWRNEREVQLAAVLAMSVLFAPIMRINYLPMLVPCAIVWWTKSRGALGDGGAEVEDVGMGEVT